MDTVSVKSRDKSNVSSFDSTSASASSNATNGNTSLPDLKSPSLASGELGQLQEILIGKQLRTSTEQLGVFQQYVEEQLASMQANHARQLNEIQSKLDKALTEVDDRLNRQFQAQNSELENRVNDALLKLNEQKLDRDALSNLLGDVASQLSQQLSPDAKP